MPAQNSHIGRERSTSTWKDVDAVYKRALDLGAESVAEPEDKPRQERGAGFKDAAGNRWWISTYRPQQ